MLSDYTALPEASAPPLPERQFDLAYLPAKVQGAEWLIDRLSRRYQMTAITGLNQQQVWERLAEVRIFLDFGHHPGKDRVPREAALCGCIPMVRHEGAARFPADVPLPEPLLVPADCFLAEDALLARIDAVLADLTRFDALLNDYRSRIQDEKRVFEQEVAALVTMSREAG